VARLTSGFAVLGCRARLAVAWVIGWLSAGRVRRARVLAGFSGLRACQSAVPAGPGGCWF